MVYNAYYGININCYDLCNVQAPVVYSVECVVKRGSNNDIAKSNTHESSTGSEPGAVEGNPSATPQPQATTVTHGNSDDNEATTSKMSLQEEAEREFHQMLSGIRDEIRNIEFDSGDTDEEIVNQLKNLVEVKIAYVLYCVIKL